MGVWTLVLAVLLSVGWGQVHRVLHLGTQALAVTDAAVGTAAHGVPGLADEDGSGLCKLLDQLTHGAGPVQTLASVPLCLPALSTGALPVAWVQTLRGRNFDARGPPQPT
jgi:hypothetical protein